MENSEIEWTDNTFNPWHGCMKVSEGCKHCYAETLDNRWAGENGSHWGPNSPRKPMSEAYWGKPLQWDQQAVKAGKKIKVFCASMADVFEDHPDVIQWRLRLFELIEKTPNLIWQLLTKRPENILKMVPEVWKDNWPENVWIGTTVENQKAADERIPFLIQVPAKVRFLSCEPLIGGVQLMHRLQHVGDSGWLLKKEKLKDMQETYPKLGINKRPEQPIQWVIVGGESGLQKTVRPIHPVWVESLKADCEAAGIPFFFKQWGEYFPFYEISKDPAWRKIPEDQKGVCRLNVEGGTNLDGNAIVYFERRGKKASGSELYGVEYKNFPEYDTSTSAPTIRKENSPTSKKNEAKPAKTEKTPVATKAKKATNKKTGA